MSISLGYASGLVSLFGQNKANVKAITVIDRGAKYEI